jgi:hypothetical protein
MGSAVEECALSSNLLFYSKMNFTRKDCVNWMINQNNKYYFFPETLLLAINIFDRYAEKLAEKEKQDEDILTSAIACFLLACKFEQPDPPRLARICPKYRIKLVLEKEIIILKSINYILRSNYIMY